MIQYQDWYGFRRILIVDEEKSASVQLDVFNDDEMGSRYKERYRADALLFSLWVNGCNRKRGEGSMLMIEAELHAIGNRCKSIALEYDCREAPEWVKRWYERLGYEEKAFGRFGVIMVKQLARKDKQ